MYRVIETETYADRLNAWPKQYQEIAVKLPHKLAENPKSGRPLSYPFLREARIKEKRIYYLVYDDLQLVLLVAVSDKKDQQPTINHIKAQLDEYKAIALEISKQLS